jgi:hypothetical protein
MWDAIVNDQPILCIWQEDFADFPFIRFSRKKEFVMPITSMVMVITTLTTMRFCMRASYRA